MSKSRVILYESVKLVDGTPPLEPLIRKARLVTPLVGATKLTSGMDILEPGCRLARHYHNAEEAMIIIEGELTLTLRDGSYRLKPYDAIFFVPGPDGEHVLSNETDRPAKIVWSFASVELTTTFVDTGETHHVQFS